MDENGIMTKRPDGTPKRNGISYGNRPSPASLLNLVRTIGAKEIIESWIGFPEPPDRATERYWDSGL
jgi:hypothetical protein